MHTPVKLRGHHGLCLHFYKGKGYSDRFVAHMTEFQNQLRANSDTPLLLVDCADSLCTFCPHKTGDACESGQKVKKYDRAVFKLCGLNPGMQITWKEFSDSVKEHILKTDQLKDICSDCQWYSICRETDSVL